MWLRRFGAATLLVTLAVCATACDDPGDTGAKTPAPLDPAPSTDKANTPAKPKAAQTPGAKASLPGEGLMEGTPRQVGFILWGAELPLFYGNGGLQTRKGTIFAEYGINIKLVPG
ncbi:MAG: hypothetical protein AAFS10_18955, partial [Myxococcota bacterium]